MIPIFEYRTERIWGKVVNEDGEIVIPNPNQLKYLGSNGWELIYMEKVVTPDIYWICTFKRTFYKDVSTGDY